MSKETFSTPPTTFPSNLGKNCSDLDILFFLWDGSRETSRSSLPGPEKRYLRICVLFLEFPSQTMQKIVLETVVGTKSEESAIKFHAFPTPVFLPPGKQHGSCVFLLFPEETWESNWQLLLLPFPPSFPPRDQTHCKE